MRQSLGVSRPTPIAPRGFPKFCLDHRHGLLQQRLRYKDILGYSDSELIFCEDKLELQTGQWHSNLSRAQPQRHFRRSSPSESEHGHRPHVVELWLILRIEQRQMDCWVLQITSCRSG